MRICVDLDGVICSIRMENEEYSKVSPVFEAVTSLQFLHESGHEIIIYTARNMKTQRANLGKVISNIGLDTLEWLKRHSVPYDEIYFGKPIADIYIDDNALKFNSWEQTLKYIIKNSQKI